MQKNKKMSNTDPGPPKSGGELGWSERISSSCSL